MHDDWADGDVDLREIGDHPVMEIPLPLHSYEITAIGERPSKRWSSHCEQNLIGYKLVDSMRPLVEGDHIPGRLNRTYGVDYVNGKGVCLLVTDHSFGRGLVRLLLGWEIIVTIPDEHANDFEAKLRRSAKGQYVRSRLYKVPSTAFSLELEVDIELAVAAKLSLDGVEIVRSKLPISHGARSDYLIEDVVRYTIS